MARTADGHLTPEQVQSESVLARYGKAAAVFACGVLVVAALYFGLIYVLTMR